MATECVDDDIEILADEGLIRVFQRCGAGKGDSFGSGAPRVEVWRRRERSVNSHASEIRPPYGAIALESQLVFGAKRLQSEISEVRSVEVCSDLEEGQSGARSPVAEAAQRPTSVH